jgi:DNA (cytosine-5)-methyltransferase 1
MNHNSAKMVPVSRAFTTSSLAEYREGVGTLRANGGDLGGGSETLIAKTLTAGSGQRYDFESDTFALGFPWQSALDPIGQPSNISGTLIKNQTMAVATPTYGIPGNWIGRAPENGGNAVEPMVDVAPCQTKTDVHAVAQPITQFGSIAGSLTARHDSSACADRGQNVVAQPVAFGVAESDSVAHCLRSGASKADKHESTTYVAQTAMQVRRLTPIECERLQGFPDGYTNIPWRKAPESPDGPRYKALGNSMAVPVMAWIGKRIQQVSEL